MIFVTTACGYQLKIACTPLIINCGSIINRNNENINTKIDIVTSANGEKTIGLYLKDKLLGIGTLTFIDPDTNIFASLGHGIYDNNVIIGTQKGTINVSSTTTFNVSSSVNSFTRLLAGMFASFFVW